jgi:biopolymer transport protein ExbD
LLRYGTCEAPCKLHLLLHADGSVEFDQAKVSDLSRLQFLLSQYKNQNPDCAVQLIGDRDVKLKVVERVFEVLKRVGYPSEIGVVTGPLGAKN